MEEDNFWGKYLLRSKGVGRIILGASLTLSLTLSPDPAQAQAGGGASQTAAETQVQGRMTPYLLPDAWESFLQNPGFSETLTTKVFPQWDELLDITLFLSPYLKVSHLIDLGGISWT